MLSAIQPDLPLLFGFLENSVPIQPGMPRRKNMYAMKFLDRKQRCEYGRNLGILGGN